MKIGMNLLLWTVHPTVGEHASLIKQILDWGFDGVELPIGLASFDEIRDLAKLCDDLGLERTGLQNFNVQVADPLSADAKLRNAAVDEWRRIP